jgi:hypothetical protein
MGQLTWVGGVGWAMSHAAQANTRAVCTLLAPANPPTLSATSCCMLLHSWCPFCLLAAASHAASVVLTMHLEIHTVTVTVVVRVCTLASRCVESQAWITHLHLQHG